MLRVVRNNTEVRIKVEAFLPTWETRVFPFSFNCGDAAYAALLATRINTVIGEAVKTAREEAYNEGYADGRGKKKRNTFFRSVL